MKPTQQSSPIARHARFAALGLLIVAVALAFLVSRSPRHFGDWGTYDFIEYWAAGQVATLGGNPWDAAQLQVIELAAGRANHTPLMMWNPPWLLVLMRPVLQLPFPHAASVWMGTNLVMATMASVLIVSGYRRSRLEASDLMPAAIVTFASVPAVITPQQGQVSILLLLAVALLYWALRGRHDIAAGVGLSVLSVKPHLFVLVALLVAFTVVREGRWRIVIGAVATMVTLVLATARISPSLLSDWSYAIRNTASGRPPGVRVENPEPSSRNPRVTRRLDWRRANVATHRHSCCRLRSVRRLVGAAHAGQACIR